MLQIYVIPGTICIVFHIIFGFIFDMYQQKGCVRTQLHVNICVLVKIAVPLHRQNK